MTSDLYFPPSGDWERREASSLGMDESALEHAVKFAKDNEIGWATDLSDANVGQDAPEWSEKLGPICDRGGPAGVVVKDGYIVAEWGDVEKVDLTFSATKSYLSAIAGIAWDSGLIKSVSDHVLDYEVDKSIVIAKSRKTVNGFDTDQNRDITWEHLLQQTSEWEGTLYTKPDIVDWNRNLSFDGMRPSAKSYRYERMKPGNHWEYNDVRVNRTALALLAVFGESLPKVLSETLMSPIGASDTWEWHGYKDHSTVDIDGLVTESVSGGAHWGGGLWIDTLDHARFGMLFLNQGRWGQRQLISQRWINMMTTPCDLNDQYGYMWWLNTRHARYGRHMSESSFAASGAGGNIVIIDPSKKLVIVTRWCEDVEGVVDLVSQAVNER